MTIQYVAVVRQLGWLLKSLEKALMAIRDGDVVDPVAIGRMISGRLPTHDELSVALRAFSDLSILSQQPGGTYRFKRDQLVSTAEYRRGVFDALAFIASEVERPPIAKLCIALPPGLPARIETSLRKEATDLRSTLLDLIAGSRSKILLASPFWDAETVFDLTDVVEKRLQAGVAVLILGRFGPNTNQSVRDGLFHLSNFPGCKVMEWYERSDEDPFGSQTFHFKAVVSDAGERAYLGTANFTASSLRSRMEIGCILSDVPARQLARVLDTVIGLSRPALLSRE